MMFTPFLLPVWGGNDVIIARGAYVGKKFLLNYVKSAEC